MASEENLKKIFFTQVFDGLLCQMPSSNQEKRPLFHHLDLVVILDY